MCMIHLDSERAGRSFVWHTIRVHVRTYVIESGLSLLLSSLSLLPLRLPLPAFEGKHARPW